MNKDDAPICLFVCLKELGYKFVLKHQQNIISKTYPMITGRYQPGI